MKVLMKFPKTRSALRLAWAVSLAAVMAGCSSAPPATFDLTAAAAARPGASRGVLVVAEPTAVSLLDSERIVVRTSGGSVAYLSGAQWADRLPKLLQSRIIQSLENSRRVGSVGRPGDRLVASAQLNADIRAFEVQEKTGEAVVEIAVKLVNDRTGRVLDGQLFTARAPAGGISGGSAAKALDQATQAVLAQMVAWSARRG